MKNIIVFNANVQKTTYLCPIDDLSMMNDLDAPKAILIDVRTPQEYQLGHIPGALNLPLFSDEERVEVGTTYLQNSREAAILLGLQYVGPRMREMVEQTLHWLREYQADIVKLYCARGGMRSASVAWLLRFYGLNVEVLEGGFKQYKAQLPHFCKSLKQLYLLDGATGSGKTLVLQALSKLGAQVIDLEGIAQHRGSAFGALPSHSEQPSNEMIACHIIQKLSSFDLHKPIFIESESKKIGSREVPDVLFERMKQSERINLSTSLETRVKLIIDQYGDLDQDYLLTSFDKIRKRLGDEKCREAQQAVLDGNLSRAVYLALSYYDKAYCQSGEQLWDKQVLSTVPFDGDAEATAREILQVISQIQGESITQ